MSDDQKNLPAQPEFGELAPEGWSWNPEANAPHTPETLKAAEAAAKAAAKAKAAPAVSPQTPDQRVAKGATASTPVAPHIPEPKISEKSLTDDEKKNRAVALARLQSDRFITWGLLGVAVFSVLGNLGDYVNLTRTLNAAYDQLNKMQPGLNLAPYSNPAFASTMGIAIVTGQAIVIGLTFWWAIRRMRAQKMAFWIPVVGFVVASAVVMIFTVIAFFGDPSAVNIIMGYLQAGGSATPMPSPTPTSTGLNS